MTEQHDQFSEQIGPYARGELAAGEAAQLEAHLGGCADCRAELEGARFLAAAMTDPLEPMSEIEKARLHREVLVATTGESRRTDTPARRGLAARVAPALGAAALFALFAFGASQLFTGMGGSDESGGADSAAGGMSTESEAQLADEGPLGLPPAAARGGTAASSDSMIADGDGSEGAGQGPASESQEETTASAYGAASPQPYFEPGQRVISESALRQLGSQRDPFDSFALSYQAGDGTDRDALTTLLSMASPEPAQVRACAAGVLDLDPNALPAYGALGTLDGDYVLALGFVTGRRGPLDRFEIWVWKVGDCTNTITRVSGQV